MKEYTNLFSGIQPGIMVYHGSDHIIKNPDVTPRGYYKDFGYGFYVTKIYEQATRYVLKYRKHQVVNSYAYHTDKQLAVKVFPRVTREWIDFIASCRTGLEHKYDIVEGPMADDQIWEVSQQYINGEVSFEYFESKCKFSRPTHQICFCTDKALNCLDYITSEVIK